MLMGLGVVLHWFEFSNLFQQDLQVDYYLKHFYVECLDIEI